tara:strand:- start:43068 stop:44519 length:1452 start_codon:yes stop_codon:yes gene_type:complete
MEEKKPLKNIFRDAVLIGLVCWLFSLAWSRFLMVALEPSMQNTRLDHLGAGFVLYPILGLLGFIPTVAVFLLGIFRRKPSFLISVLFSLLFTISFVPVQELFYPRPDGGMDSRKAVLQSRADELNAQPIPAFPTLPDEYFRVVLASYSRPPPYIQREIMAGRIKRIVDYGFVSERTLPKSIILETTGAREYRPKPIDECTTSDFGESGASQFVELVFDPDLPNCVSKSLSRDQIERPEIGLVENFTRDNSGSLQFRYVKERPGQSAQTRSVEYTVVQSYTRRVLRETYDQPDVGIIQRSKSVSSGHVDSEDVWASIEPTPPRSSIVPEQLTEFRFRPAAVFEARNEPVISYRQQAESVLADLDRQALREHLLRTVHLLDDLNGRSDRPLSNEQSRLAAMGTALCLVGSCDESFENLMVVVAPQKYRELDTIAYLNTLPPAHRDSLKTRILQSANEYALARNDWQPPEWLSDLEEDGPEVLSIR